MMIPLFAVLLAAAAQTPVDLAATRMVDLTHPLNAATIYWPTSPSTFKLERLSFGPTPGGWFYAANAFSAPEHGGTHIDAPVHFSELGQTVDAIPLGKLVAPAVVIDIVARAAADPDARLTPKEIDEFETAHGKIPQGAIVLLRTGWSRRWPDRNRSSDLGTTGVPLVGAMPEATAMVS